MGAFRFPGRQAGNVTPSSDRSDCANVIPTTATQQTALRVLQVHRAREPHGHAGHPPPAHGKEGRESHDPPAPHRTSERDHMRNRAGCFATQHFQAPHMVDAHVRSCNLRIYSGRRNPTIKVIRIGFAFCDGALSDCSDGSRGRGHGFGTGQPLTLPV